jgi:hypothetical protein
MRAPERSGKLKLIARRAFSLSCCIYLLVQPLYPQFQGSAGSPYENADSLLSGKSGIEKVETLLEISQSRWFISFEESMEYANRAYRLAIELDYPEGQADALNRIGNVHYFLRNHGDVIESYNMALKIAAFNG